MVAAPAPGGRPCPCGRLDGRGRPLVFAAYNCGEGRVGGALKRNNATSYAAIAKSLPLETQMYVPRVQETIRLRSGKLF